MSISSPDILCKHPDDVTDYAMDFSNWLATADVLSSPTATISGEDSDLTASSVAVSSQTVTFILDFIFGLLLQNYSKTTNIAKLKV